MPSKYFQKSGTQHGLKSLIPFLPQPIRPKTDAEVDELEAREIEKSILAASHQSGEERFFDWMLELFTNTDFRWACVPLRETVLNVEEIWEQMYDFPTDSICFGIEEDEDPILLLLAQSDLPEERRKFLQIELAWADYRSSDLLDLKTAAVIAEWLEELGLPVR